MNLGVEMKKKILKEIVPFTFHQNLRKLLSLNSTKGKFQRGYRNSYKTGKTAKQLPLSTETDILTCFTIDFYKVLCDENGKISNKNGKAKQYIYKDSNSYFHFFLVGIAIFII